MNVCTPAQFRKRFFWTTQPAFALAKFVAYGHEDLTKTTFLPGWKYDDASEVVVIPTEFFFAEEANDLGAWRMGRSIGIDKEVVEKRCYVIEHRLSVEEQLGEEGEVLGI